MQEWIALERLEPIDIVISARKLNAEIRSTFKSSTRRAPTAVAASESLISVTTQSGYDVEIHTFRKRGVIVIEQFLAVERQ